MQFGTITLFIYTDKEHQLNVLIQEAQKLRKKSDKTILEPPQVKWCADKKIKQTTNKAQQYQTIMESMKKSKFSSATLFPFALLFLNFKQHKIYRFLQVDSSRFCCSQRALVQIY